MLPEKRTKGGIGSSGRREKEGRAGGLLFWSPRRNPRPEKASFRKYSGKDTRRHCRGSAAFPPYTGIDRAARCCQGGEGEDSAAHFRLSCARQDSSNCALRKELNGCVTSERVIRISFLSQVGSSFRNIIAIPRYRSNCSTNMFLVPQSEECERAQPLVSQSLYPMSVTCHGSCTDPAFRWKAIQPWKESIAPGPSDRPTVGRRERKKEKKRDKTFTWRKRKQNKRNLNVGESGTPHLPNLLHHNHSYKPWTTAVLPAALGLCLVALPISQDIADAGGVRQTVDVLKVLLSQLEGAGGDVRDVFPDQLARVDASLVDLLEQEGAEGLDAGAEEGAVEGDVDALERDDGEAALELDGLGLGFRLLGALLDDVLQVLLDVLQAHRLHQGLDVDLLRLEVVGDVGHGVNGAEVACADVLLCLLVERLADTRRVDGSHRVVRTAGLVTLDGDLHGQATVEDDRYQALNWHDLCKRSKSTVLTQRVTGKATVALHKTLGVHVLERSLLHQSQSRLSELSSRKQARWRPVGV
ncbi:beta subunit of fatty acid synthase [Hortaea werneckii]|nr:beta subunit of fatty acid synthase [Hortaea werneckii]